MTDAQWVWLYVHGGIDNDEQLERMCPKCRDEVISDNRCTRCGKDIATIQACTNPNFDLDKYNRMNDEADGRVVNTGFDNSRYDELNK